MTSLNRILTLVLTLFVAVTKAFITPNTWGLLHSSPSAPTKLCASSTPTILEPPTTGTVPESGAADQQQQKHRQKEGHSNDAGWEVRIWNDGLNTREHVARSLVVVVAEMSEQKAYQTMMHAHQNGVAVVGRWQFETAELYQEQLQLRGIGTDLVPVEDV